MASQPQYNKAASTADAPTHPVPQLQGPFEESMMESLHDHVEGNTGEDPMTRRNMLLTGKNYKRIVAGRWKQKPGEKFHPLWKISAQISFGMHLLAQGMAKSDEEVMKILQSHVDDIDGFLERTTEDFDLAESDVQERLRYLKLPLEHVEVFDRMLDDRAFRASIVEGNEKIEHIVDRTSEAMRDALKDVQKGLDSTNALGNYLNELGETWRRDRPEHEAVFNAMAGNLEGWNRAFMDLQLRGHRLAVALVQLGGVVAEMQRRAGVASRKPLASSLESNKEDALIHDQTRKTHESIYARRTSPRSAIGPPSVPNKPLPLAPDPLRPARQLAREKIAYDERMRRQSSPTVKVKGGKETIKHTSAQARPIILAETTKALKQQVSAPDLVKREYDSKGPNPSRQRLSPKDHLLSLSHTVPGGQVPVKVELAHDPKPDEHTANTTETPVELEADVPPKPEKRSRGLRIKNLRLSMDSDWEARFGYTSPTGPSSPRVISAILSGPLFPRMSIKSRSSSAKGSAASGTQSTTTETSGVAEQVASSSPFSKSPDVLTQSTVGTQQTLLPTPEFSDFHQQSPGGVQGGMADGSLRPEEAFQRGTSRHHLNLRNLAFTSHPPNTSTPLPVSPPVSSSKSPDGLRLPSRLSTVPAVPDLDSKHTSYYSILGEPGPEVPNRLVLSEVNAPVQLTELESHTPLIQAISESQTIKAQDSAIVERLGAQGSILKPDQTWNTMRSTPDSSNLCPQEGTERVDSAAESGEAGDHAQSGVGRASQNHRQAYSPHDHRLSSLSKPRSYDSTPVSRPKPSMTQSELLDFISSTPPHSPIHARSSLGASSHSNANSARLSLSRNPHSESTVLAPPEEAPAPPAPGGRSMVNPDFASARVFEGERRSKRSSVASDSGWKKMFALGYSEGRSSEESAGMMSAGGKDVLWFKSMGPDGMWVAGS